MKSHEKDTLSYENFSHLHNEERMLENQLIKKMYVKLQSLDQDDDDFQAKPIAEKILKVIGK